MIKFYNSPVTLPVSKRVELTTIWESDEPVTPIRRHGLHDAIDRHFSWQTFEQSRHWSARIPSIYNNLNFSK